MRFTLICLAFIACIGCGKSDGKSNAPKINQPVAASSAKVWDKDELEAAIKGKTTAEVIALLGKPDFTEREPEKSEGFFQYDRIIKDKFNGKHKTALVYFANGQASRT